MFLINQPAVRQLEFFSTVPENFRKKKRTIWADANQGGREIDSFLEGPVFDEAGNLYVTDIAFGRVFCVDPNGKWDLVTQWDGEPNGMKYIADKKLLVTDYKNGLVLLDICSGQVKPYFSRKNTESFKGVNDLAISANGDIYFTDQGQTGLHDPSGRVYRLEEISFRGRHSRQLRMANAAPAGRRHNESGTIFHVLWSQRARRLGDGSTRTLAGGKPWPCLYLGTEPTRRACRNSTRPTRSFPDQSGIWRQRWKNLVCYRLHIRRHPLPAHGRARRNFA